MKPFTTDFVKSGIEFCIWISAIKMECDMRTVSKELTAEDELERNIKGRLPIQTARRPRFLSSDLSWVWLERADLFIFLKIFIYLFLRERAREGERGGEKRQHAGQILIGCLWYIPSMGPGLHPRHVP